MVTVWRWARPWVIPTRFSFRVSVQRAGRPSRRATQHTTACSGSAPNLAPNAPPTSGVMIRIRPGRSRACPASAALGTLRALVGDPRRQPAVRPPGARPRPGSPSGPARPAGWRSSGRPPPRSRRTGRPSSASGSPKVAATLVPAAGNSTGPNRPWRVGHVDHGRQRRSRCPPGPGVLALVAALGDDHATGSPTNRTTSRASSHWPISAFIIPASAAPVPAGRPGRPR
jgi:hypothetical protein